MKKQIFTLCTLCLLAFNAMQAQTAFTEGNLVILSVGKSGETLGSSGNTVYLNEYDTQGNLVQSIALPATGTDKLILSGTDDYCGYLNRSSNEKYLTLTGFDATIGQVTDLDASDPATVKRTVAIVDANFNIDYSTKLSDVTYTPRSAVTTDGSKLWLSAPSWQKKVEGAGSILYTQKGNTARICDINRRNYSFGNFKTFIHNGNPILFGTRTDVIYTGYTSIGSVVTDDDENNYVLTSIPEAFEGGTYGNFNSVYTQILGASEFVLVDQFTTITGLDVGYSHNIANSGEGIYKFTHETTATENQQNQAQLGGSAYTLPNTDIYKVYGLTVGNSCADSIVLYASCYNTDAGVYQLLKITDKTTEPDVDPSANITIEVLANAPSGTTFRGIALAPVSGKTSQNISNFANISKTWGDDDIKLEATATSGNPVVYSVQYDSIATIDANDSLHILQAGVTEIYASVEGNDSYKPAEATISLTVEKARQVVSGLSDITKKSSDADFSVSLPILKNYHHKDIKTGLVPYYIVDDESIVEMTDDTTFHIVGAGSTKVYVMNDGNENYYDVASSVDEQNYTFTITIKEASEQEINNFNDITKTVEDADFELKATATGGGDITYSIDSAHVATISGNTVHIVGQGIAHITAYNAGDDTYDPVEKTVTLTVRYTQTIDNITNITKTWGDDNFYLEDKASSGLNISYGVYSGTCIYISDNLRNYAEIKSAGTSTLVASQPGNEDYAAAENVYFTITVNKADQEISNFSDITKTVGDADFDLAATATSEEAVTYTISDETVATISGSTVHLVGEGTATITATQAGTDNYNSVTKTVSLTVKSASKTDQEISNFTDITKTCGDANFDLSATASSNLEVSYSIADTSIAEVSGSTVQVKKGGQTTITASQAGNETYNAISASITLTVNKLTQTLTVSSDSIGVTTNDDDFELDVTASSGLDVTYSSSNIYVAKIDGDSVRIVGTGVTIITAKQEGNGYYEAVESTIKLTVEQYTSVEQDEAPESTFTLYPNPVTQGEVNLEFGKEMGDNVISILDITGKTVYQQNVEPGITSTTIDVSHFRSGIYFICLSGEDGRMVKKMVKK